MTRQEATQALATARKNIGAVLAEYDPAEVERETVQALAEARTEARTEEIEAVLSFLRRKGSLAYLTGDSTRQLLIAELVGELERGEHRR